MYQHDNSLVIVFLPYKNHR